VFALLLLCIVGLAWAVTKSRRPTVVRGGRPSELVRGVGSLSAWGILIISVIGAGWLLVTLFTGAIGLLGYPAMFVICYGSGSVLFGDPSRSPDFVTTTGQLHEQLVVEIRGKSDAVGGP
jgi:hypothetical protein